MEVSNLLDPYVLISVQIIELRFDMDILYFIDQALSSGATAIF